VFFLVLGFMRRRQGSAAAAGFWPAGRGDHVIALAEHRRVFMRRRRGFNQAGEAIM
jgi:hypothetical protein